jgi:hypothetical protein
MRKIKDNQRDIKVTSISTSNPEEKVITGISK